MAKLDVEKLIGLNFKNEHGDIKILEYIGKDKEHIFKVRFIETGNEYEETLSRIKKGISRDYKQEKVERAKKKMEKVKKDHKVKKHVSEKWSIEGLEKLNVLAIDLSTTKTGLAVFFKGAYRWSCLCCKSNSDELDARKRSRYTAEFIRKVITDFEVDAIVLEGIYLGFNTNVLIKLAEARGMIFSIIDPEIRVEIIPIKAWKNALDINSKEDGEKMFFNDLGKKPNSNDESDAYCIGKFATRGEDNRGDVRGYTR